MTGKTADAVAVDAAARASGKTAGSWGPGAEAVAAVDSAGSDADGIATAVTDCRVGSATAAAAAVTFDPIRCPR